MSNTNHEISLEQAINLTHSFQAQRPTGFPICETFDMGAINKLTSASGCVSFRIYLGMKEDESVVTVLVAVDEDGNDILPEEAETPNELPAESDTDPIILEDGFRCPQYCPSSSPLIAS